MQMNLKQNCTGTASDGDERASEKETGNKKCNGEILLVDKILFKMVGKNSHIFSKATYGSEITE